MMLIAGQCEGNHKATFNCEAGGWKNAIALFSSTVRTVLIRMDGMAVDEVQELEDLDAVLKSVRQVAPSARITICRDGNQRRLPDDKLAAYRAVVDRGT